REPKEVRLVRDEVALAPPLRHPGRVEHVHRLVLEARGLPARAAELARGREAELGAAELPPPPVADDVDLERAGRRGGLRLEDRLDRRDGDEDEDDGGDRGPGDLKTGVAMDLLGGGAAGPLAVLDDRIDQGALDDDEDD